VNGSIDHFAGILMVAPPVDHGALIAAAAFNQGKILVVDDPLAVEPGFVVPSQDGAILLTRGMSVTICARRERRPRRWGMGRSRAAAQRRKRRSAALRHALDVIDVYVRGIDHETRTVTFG
jgi:hypothetical protein